METKFSLDRFTLKCIAVAAMLIDHTAAIFLVGLTVGSWGWIYCLLIRWAILSPSSFNIAIIYIYYSIFALPVQSFTPIKINPRHVIDK